LYWLFLPLIASCFYDILQVCKFLEVSKLSFSLEYGPKLKEGYVMVKHLPQLSKDNREISCLPCQWFGCCSNSWQKVFNSLNLKFRWFNFVWDDLSDWSFYWFVKCDWIFLELFNTYQTFKMSVTFAWLQLNYKFLMLWLSILALELPYVLICCCLLFCDIYLYTFFSR